MNNEINHGAEGTELELAEGHNESRVYELGFHVDPEFPQEEAKKVYVAIRDAASKAGSIVAEGELQKIPLAYTISRMETGGRRDFDSAYFGWVAYEADTAGHEAVVATMKTPAIIRFLDVRTTKDGAKHAAEMHEIYAKMAEEKPEVVEEVSEVELDAALKDAGV